MSKRLPIQSGCPGILKLITIWTQFREFQKHTKAQRQKSLDEMHLQLKKFIDKRLQAALVSLSARIVRHRHS